MNTSRIIRGIVNSRGYTITSAITQWDYGWQFIPEIEDLPATYRLDFSNDEHHGTALPVYCGEEGGEVPEELIDTGKDIWVWFFYIGDGFGKSEYKWKIPNKCKPKNEQDEPSPSQQSSIDQLIVRSNEAVTSAEQSALAAGQSARSASDDANRAERARTGAETAQGKAEAAQESAERAKDDAEISERNASESERKAKGYAETASEKADAITGLTAQATTLPDGSSATASYNAETGVMSFGIPKGKDGTDGDDGYSPTAYVSKTGKVATITITDKNGTTSAQVEDGEDGTDGIDGISPSVSVTDITGGHRVVITDKDGAKSFDVEDGATGATPNLTIGTVETLDPTDDATATITGTPENPVLNLWIPKGRTGEVSQAEFDEVADDVSDLKEDFTAKTDNLLPFKSGTTIVNGVQVKNNGAMGLSITGTATSSGGRGSKLSEDITLPAGEYWFYAYGEGSVPSICLQSAGTILSTITYFDTFLKVSIESESVVYVGINVTSGVQYDVTNAFICLSAEEPLLAPHISAVDFVARDNARYIKDISLNSYQSLKEVFPFSVGSIITSGGGGVNYSTRYRIASARKYVADVPLRVYMPTGYKFGVITFPNGELVDSGWRYGEYIIPANMPFYIQLAKNPEVTSDKITNVKDSDLYRALEFSAYTQSLKRQILSLEKLNANDVWSQGACKVGSTLLGFAASAEDHSTNGNIFRYDLANDFAELPRMYHNLGHASVADYARSTDTAIVGTGTYTSGSQEAIYLIKNMQSKNSDGYSISVSDSDVVELDVSGLDGVSCGACFGETDQIMYLIKVESAMQYDVLIKKYIYKILLGKSSNDLTVSHPTSNIGSYISGCADNEYNGTACVLETYVIDVYGEMQGLKYRNGYLIYATDTSHFDGQKTPYIAKIDLLNETVEYFKLPFYNSTTGAELVAESEGIVIDGVDAYTAIVGSGQSGVFKFSSVF